MTPRVHLDVDRTDDHLVVRWSDARSSGSCRFDRVPGTSPEWLGPADELFDGAGRRVEGQIVDALAAWARQSGLDVGLWRDGGGVEVLG